MESSVDSFKSAEDDKCFEEQRNEMEYSDDIFESNKNNELEEQEYRRKTKIRLIIIATSSIVLILIIIGAVCGIGLPTHTADNSPRPAIDTDSIKMVCNTTLYHESCFSKMSYLNISDTKEVFIASLQVAIDKLVDLSYLPQRLISSENCNHNDSSMPNESFHCEFLIREAIEHVNMSILSLQTGARDEFSTTIISKVRTWLSTAVTDQETCLDELMKIEICTGNVLEDMKSAIRNSTQVINNLLKIISNIFTMIHDFKNPVHRKLLQAEQGGDTGFIGTVSRGEFEPEFVTEVEECHKTTLEPFMHIES
ncbi:putative pectinesterase/pectinesterase inhibitor 26 [Abeliophyllum distichum]|uniref:Pectinesterase/pectinesterase inhibitor 26 n=1 Tax=Abeliophyllum distichum TaxID=126358 RepID=A0ABD1R2C1_9LAMI